MADEQNQTPPAKDPAAELNDRINAAVSSHIKRFEKSFSESFGKSLDEKLAALATSLKAADPPPDKEKAKVDPEISALRTKHEELLKRLEDTEKARLQAEAQRRDEATFHKLKTLLKDVRPELQETAAKILFSVDKRVTFDEQGNPLFRIKRSPFAGQPEEEMDLPLEDGVQHWLKSDAAKVFIPAPVATGGGTARPGGRNPVSAQSRSSGRSADGRPTWDQPAKTDEERAVRAMEMERWLTSRPQNT